MPSSRYTSNISGGGLTISAGKTRETDNAESFTPTLPAGKAGTLTTRTDDDTGVATLSGGHGIVTSDVVDVYWSGGSRYGMDATVAVNAVTIDGGAGDNLPAQDTALVVTKQVQVTISMDGDNVALFGVKAEFADQASTDKAQVTFHDAADDVIAHLDLNANQLTIIDVEGGDTNPFAGDPITYARATCGSSSAACTLKMVKAQDSTP
jgi:hypothetical protein